MMLPSARTSAKAFFILSSNSPRYFEPAMTADKSRLIIFLFFNTSGMFPSTIFCAKPSTIAVFPTPGSPTRQGLFFVLLLKICMIRSISKSLPTMGSNLLFFAISVRLRLNLSSVSVGLFSCVSPFVFIPRIPEVSFSPAPSMLIISAYTC